MTKFAQLSNSKPRATNRNSLLPTQPTTSKEGSNMQSESMSSILDETGGTSGNSDGDLGGILVTSTSSSVGLTGHSTAASSNPVKNNNNNNSKKKRGHRREDCEFEIISCNQKQWEFSASSAEERDEWVSLIEEQIEKCIQLQPSQKQQQNNRAHGNKAEVQALRDINGNDKHSNLHRVFGIHRNLGSHISRVRSIDLDDWPVEYLLVMQAIGNDLANSIWEHNAPNGKPTPESSREQKENWIKIKCEEKDVNGIIGNGDKRTPIHLACSIGAAEVLQLLIWYNADIRLLDEMGRSALWHARHNGSKECVAILLNAGLPTDYGLGQQQYPSMMTNSTFSHPPTPQTT
uniref:Uncharacterized protein n=1 Tax=Ditylenchus dipsaci TaxID=166011 RepID=A0A915CLT9_9BILA